MLKHSEIVAAADRRAQETMNPSLYSKIVFQASHSRKLANEARRVIVLAARHVMLLDSYHETGTEAYKIAAEEVLGELFESIPLVRRREFRRTYKRLSSYWTFEKVLMEKGMFSRRSRKNYIKRKSSDVIFYSLISSMVSPFPEKVFVALRAAQQLNDIHDDLIDGQEDRSTNSPNLLFLFSPHYLAPSDLKIEEKEEIQKLADSLLLTVRRSQSYAFISRRALGLYRKIVRELSI